MPSDWAIEEAVKRSYAQNRAGPPPPFLIDSVKGNHRNWPAYIAFAEFIEKYEKPPVSVELRAVREAMGRYFDKCGYPEVAKKYRDGGHDNDSSSVYSLSAIETYKEMINNEQG